MPAINVSLLKANLKQATAKPQPDHKKALSDLSDGAAYLYENVLLPLSAGKAVSSSALSLDAFDLDDYELLFGYYSQFLTDESPEHKKLKYLYSDLLKAKPVAVRTAFI